MFSAQMPVTRSVTRATNGTPTSSTSTKRKCEAIASPRSSTSKARKPKRSIPEQPIHFEGTLGSVPPQAHLLDRDNDQPVDLVLDFSFEDAKAHLINVDTRFAELFKRLKCKPFQHLEQVHPFRSLVQSILGQQISWLAARSINHRFLRLYDPTLPERPGDYSHVKSPTSFFPSPHQVAQTDIAILKSAGLSTRKAEYVKDLATRFADGRLSSAKLLNANDEELLQMLIEVRGIGRWTVDMFAIFTLRRQNILPVGDLGVQRGMVRWYGGTGFKIRSDKVEGDDGVQEGFKSADNSGPANHGDSKTNYSGVGMVNATPRSAEVPGDPSPQGFCMSMASLRNNEEVDTLPTFTDRAESTSNTPSGHASRFPMSHLPQPFTPSINKVLEGDLSEGDQNRSSIRPWQKQLPNGLTTTMLKNRLNGKKVKGALLTPQEMEALAATWVPYRSLAVYYMWALVDED